MSMRDVVEETRELSPDVLRGTISGVAEKKDHPTAFKLFANVVTYNWIVGNDGAGWPGKSFEWYPIDAPDAAQEGDNAAGDEPTHHFVNWYETLRSNPLNMLLAARKHTKTTFACCLMMYRSEYMDGHTSLYWANTENQVKERMEELGELIRANPWLQHLHTDTALLRKEFHNGSRIRTTWVQGAAEGGHVDLSLGDDPMKEFADIPDARIEEWYGKVIVPMLNPDGLHAIIGTRKRPSDLYELLRTKHEADEALADLPSYTLTEYPAIREAWIDEYDRPQDLAPAHVYTPCEAPSLASALDLDTDTLHILWPEARPPEWLAKNLGGQGGPYFMREFNMVFRQAEDAIVQRAWIQATATDRAPPASFEETHRWQPRDHPEAVTREDFEAVGVGIDPAGAGRDRFAFVTVGDLRHGTTPDGEPVICRHVLDAWQRQDVPPSEFRSKLEALHSRYRPDVLALEANLNQTWVADDEAIPKHVRRDIETITTTRRKHSWKEGVPRIGSDIEAGKYRFYTGGGDHTSELITALTSVQRDPSTGDLVGHTPDLVMALYMCHRALDSPGGATSSRTSLDGSASGEDRETRDSLRESEIGRAILDTRDRIG